MCARPLKRAVIKLIETPVSRLVIAGKIMPGATLAADAKDGELLFTVK